MNEKNDDYIVKLAIAKIKKNLRDIEEINVRLDEIKLLGEIEGLKEKRETKALRSNKGMEVI